MEISQKSNPRLEGELINAILHDPETLDSTLEFVTNRTFSVGCYSVLFDTFLDLDEQGVDISSKTVINALTTNGALNAITVDGMDLRGIDAINFLADLPIDGERISSLSLAKQLQDVEVTQDLFHLAEGIRARAKNGDKPEKIISFVDEEVSKMPMSSSKELGKISTAKIATKNFLKRYEAIASGQIEPYVETTLDAIDEMIGGIGKGKVVMIAGTSGDGKTILAQNILNYVSIESENPRKSAFIKMEGGEFEAYARFVQFQTGIQALDIERGRVQDKDWDAFTKAYQEIENSQIIINASPSGMTMRQLKNRLIKLAALDVELVVIDQLNNLELESEKSYLDADKKGYLIKKWAEELDLAVIAIHQMNKSAGSVYRKGKFNVSMSDIAESGEKAMDAVIFTRHDETKTLLMIVKARVGQLGNVVVGFDMITSKYYNHKSFPEALSDAEYLESEEEED